MTHSTSGGGSWQDEARAWVPGLDGGGGERGLDGMLSCDVMILSHTHVGGAGGEARIARGGVLARAEGGWG